MQSSNRYRQRSGKHHHERRDRGESSRHDRNGNFDPHRHARHSRRHRDHDDTLETIPATLAAEEDVQGDDYIQSWLRKTQEPRSRRKHDQGEEGQQRLPPQKESPRAHLEMLRKKDMKKRMRPIPITAGSFSERRERVEEGFEKRARHKTLADKYEYRPDRGTSGHAAKRARVAEEPELVVNKGGRKKGAKGWRAQLRWGQRRWSKVEHRLRWDIQVR